MASTSDKLYVTYVNVDRGLLKIWGQRTRIAATYIERQLLQLLPEFSRAQPPNPSQIHKGMFCFAKYSDENYYRARVISTVQNDSVGLLFVDYGNRDFIKLSNIRLQEGTEGEVLSKMSEQAEEFYLAGVSAPSFGWTKEVISEVRHDICYDEFSYEIIEQVGDQKILKIFYENQNFSNYLVKKRLANPLSLPVQKQMILCYCGLVPSDVKHEGESRDSLKVTFSPLVPHPARPSFRSSNAGSNEEMMPFDKTNNVVQFSQLPPTAQYFSPKHKYPAVRQTVTQNSDKKSHFSPRSHPSNQIQASAPLPPIGNPVLNPMVGSQFNPLQFAKETESPFNGNNNIIKILAQQVKQYIAEDNAKAEPEAKIPHHYVNSVLEVGDTHNVITSYIDDGPWSFSVRFLSSEIKLQKLMSELASAELFPLKPPFILGQPCIASSVLYGTLCRGVVVGVSHSAVKIYFVDFGNTEDLPSSSIYELSPKFFQIRVLSQKFSLSGLEKVAYSDDIKKIFKEVVQDKLLMLRVISLEGDNLPTCELFLKNKNIKRILNEKIRELRNSLENDFPKVGDTENVVVTWVVSPQKFFVQLHKRDAELNALKKELEEVEENGQRLSYQELRVGFKCVCLYEPDGRWYRAVITSVDSENAITVFYIDYGNTETVCISFLRKVESSALISKMNNQAIQCSLKEFENKPFDQALANKLENLILEKDLQMTVVSLENELLCVNLYEKGKDICEELLTERHSELKSLETFSVSTSNDSTLKVAKEREQRFETSPEELYGKKDSKSFSSDKIRRKSNYCQPTSNLQNFKPPVRPTPIQSTRRLEGSWRDEKKKEVNFNEPNQKWKPREFKQSKCIDMWESSKNDSNNKFGGLKQEGGRSDRSDRNDNSRFDKSRKFKQERGWDDKKDNNFGEKKKFEDTRGEREKFDDKKFGERGIKRFDKSKGRDFTKSSDEPRKLTAIGLGKEFDELELNKKQIKKDVIAPPGSKYEETVLSPGTCEKGIVTYYFNPHDFFVQLLTQNEEFRKMMKDIQVYYSDKCSITNPVQTGDIVIAQFSVDKVLYRAEVIKPSPVTIRYVDYGNQEPVGPKFLWPVDKQFLKLPKQVFKCKLANIEPIGLDWPPPGSAIDRFFESEYNITFLSLEGDTYIMSLEDIATGKDVASEIIAAGLARPMAPKLDIPEIDFSLLPNQVLRLRVSHVEASSKFYVVLNSEALELIENELKSFCEDKKNLIPLSEYYIKAEMLCLCTVDDITWHRGKVIKTDKEKVLIWCCDRGDIVEVKTSKVVNLPKHLKDFQPQVVECCLNEVSPIENEAKFKKNVENKQFLVSVVSSCNGRLSVILYDEDGQKLDFQKSDDFPQAIEPIGELPIISQALPVEISQAESFQEIYIQRKTYAKKLESLCQQIESFYSEGKEGFDIEEETKGMLVAAKSISHGTWNRGRLLSSTEEGSKVFYVDYGPTDFLPKENIKKLDPSFLKFDAFCKKFALNVKIESDKTTVDFERFLELCKNKDLLGYFENNGGNMSVDVAFDGEKISRLLQSYDKFAEIETKTHKPPPDLPKSTETNTHKTPPDVPKSTEQVFVSHVDSPKQFWVHKEATMNVLNEFQDKLQKICEELPEKKNAAVGDVVAAVFCEEWVRAKVINTEGSNLTLQFVDYGNTLVLNLDSNIIKELPEEFVTAPYFASRFALAGNWDETSTSKFVEIFLQNEDPVSVVVLEESDPLVVDLYQNGKSITEMLKRQMKKDGDLCAVYLSHCNSPDDFYIQKESCAEDMKILSERLYDVSTLENASSVVEKEIYAAKFAEDEAWYRARVEKVRGDEIEVHFIDYGNTSTVNEVKCLPADLLVIPVLAENYSLLYGKTCDSWSEAAFEKFEEFCDGRKLEMKVVVNRAKRPIVKLFDEDINISEELATLCENDGRSEVVVTHAVSPTEFYVRFLNDENNKKVVEILSNCDEEKVLENPEPGSLCQALYLDDGCWYRAKVLRNLNEGCEVFFIDFGNVSVVTELKALPYELENIGPTALRCSLNLQETNLSESGKEEFLNLTQDETHIFRILIIKPGDVNIVSLKLDGRILEETLNLEESGFVCERGFPDNFETDDGKNSKLKNEDYLISNLESELRTSAANETDEEKRVKIAISEMEEGFKSDDEKGTVISTYVNATDNELMEEAQERETATEGKSDDSNISETLEEVDEIPKKEGPSEEPEITSADQENMKSNETGKPLQEEQTEPAENDLNKVHEVETVLSRKASPSRVKEEEMTETCPPQQHQKSTVFEELLPERTSRSVSLEAMSGDFEPLGKSPEVQLSQSAPNTPSRTLHNDSKTYQSASSFDCSPRVVSLHSSTGGKEIPPTDEAVPEPVNDSAEDQ